MSSKRVKLRKESSLAEGIKLAQASLGMVRLSLVSVLSGLREDRPSKKKLIRRVERAIETIDSQLDINRLASRIVEMEEEEALTDMGIAQKALEAINPMSGSSIPLGGNPPRERAKAVTDSEAVTRADAAKHD